MLDAGIIEPVEESKWISPIIVQDKKTTSEVHVGDIYHHTHSFWSIWPI